MVNSSSAEANGSQLVKKFPGFYWTRMFISLFTSARQLSLPWARSIQSRPLISYLWSYISILSSHLLHCLPFGLIPSGLTTKNCRLFSSPIHATYAAQHFLLYLITPAMLGGEFRSLSSSSFSFIHSSITSSLIGLNIILSTLFSKIINLRSSLNVSEHDSQLYVLVQHNRQSYRSYTLILNRKLEDTTFCIE